ncbi:unnamed protein product [Prunus armeniaca]
MGGAEGKFVRGRLSRAKQDYRAGDCQVSSGIPHPGVSTNEDPGPYRIPQQAEGRRGSLLYRRPCVRHSVAVAAGGTKDFGPDRLCSGTI